jgi:hypothetical protein
MATISAEMVALIKYAQDNGLCLYLIDDKEDPEFEGWEDMLWDPTELRAALLDYPEQTGGGLAYPVHSYLDLNLNDHAIWRIVDPRDIFGVVEDKAKALFDEARAQQELAQEFKRIWIDRSEAPHWKRPALSDDELA